MSASSLHTASILISHTQSASFSTIDRTVSLVVVLCQAPALHPNIHIDDRPTMYKMMSKLLRYLRPDCSPYHVRSVNLIWSLDATTKKPHVESILAQTMTSPESRNIQESYEAFGVLWRLTGSSRSLVLYGEVDSTLFENRGHHVTWFQVQGPDDDSVGYSEE